MARNARRNYVRDNRGRFASTPGGGPAKKAKPVRTSFRQRQAVSLARQRGQTGRLGSATKAMKAKLAASRKKLATNAIPQQKAAVTRAARMAAMLAGQRRIKAGGQAGVLRGAAARGVKKAAGARVRPGTAQQGAIRGKPRMVPGATSSDVYSRAKRTNFPTKSITPDVTDRPPLKKSAASLTRKRARDVYGGQLLKGTNIKDGSFSLDQTTVRAPFGRFSTVKNPAPAKSFPSQAPLRTKKGELVARKGRASAAAAARAARKASAAKPKPARPTSKVLPPGSRRKVRGPKMAGTIAKPKGLKPGALAERRQARGRARRAVEPLGTRLNRAYIRAKATEAYNDPRTLRGTNTRKNDRSFSTARKAASFLAKGEDYFTGRARKSTAPAKPKGSKGPTAKPSPQRKPKSAENLIAQSNRIDQRSRRMSYAARTGFRARQIESRAERAVKAARARAVELSKPKPESKTTKAKRERAERVRYREQLVNANRLIMEARRRR